MKKRNDNDFEALYPLKVKRHSIENVLSLAKTPNKNIFREYLAKIIDTTYVYMHFNRKHYPPHTVLYFCSLIALTN